MKQKSDVFLRNLQSAIALQIFINYLIPNFSGWANYDDIRKDTNLEGHAAVLYWMINLEMIRFPKCVQFI